MTLKDEILAFLQAHPRRKYTNRDIRLNVRWAASAATMRGLLNRMEKQGLIMTRGTTENRQKLYKITDKGINEKVQPAIAHQLSTSSDFPNIADLQSLINDLRPVDLEKIKSALEIGKRVAETDFERAVIADAMRELEFLDDVLKTSYRFSVKTTPGLQDKLQDR